MSLDVLAQLRAQGTQPCLACVTTDAHLAARWAENAGIWPVVVEGGCEYDFSPLAGIPTILALPQLRGRDAQLLARALMAVTANLTAYDIELDQTSVVIEA